MRYLFFGLILLFMACRGDYFGFRESEEDLHYKVEMIGEDQHVLKPGQYVALQYAYCENSKCKKVKPDQWLFKKIEEFDKGALWQDMHVGDQYTLVLDSNVSEAWKRRFKLDQVVVSWPVIVRLHVEASVELGKFTGKKKAMERLYGFREKQEIDRMIKEEKNGEFIKINGVFIDQLKVGNALEVAVGREVVLSYQAFFSNGVKFDDTSDWSDTLKIIYGSPQQIIPGLENGILGLKEGGEAKIIIPSQLAFGAQGSSSGIVPPHEPLLYKIKVVSVKEFNEDEN